jgi:hypothetical protein
MCEENWMVAKPSKEERALALLYSCFELFLLNLFWMVLEIFLYGEVQHRIVDDIIAIPILFKFYQYNKFMISIKRQ